MFRKLGAEFFGTFWLVLGGCGAAVLSAGVADVGIGWLGVALAFGLTVMVMIFAVGYISGGHFNPAVSFGLWAGRRFDAKDLAPYIAVQIVAAIAAAGVLYIIASGVDSFTTADGFAANGYGEHSPGGYSLAAGIVTEFVLTFVFVLVILGATSKRAAAGFAPIAIGLALTGVHLVGIPVTNMSVNPARSIGPALFVGDWAIEQLWMFIVVPIVGAIAAGLVHSLFLEPADDPAEV